MKLTVSRSKNSASFYVQKTIRKPNGSTTTITVEKLGNNCYCCGAQKVHACM